MAQALLGATREQTVHNVWMRTAGFDHARSIGSKLVLWNMARAAGVLATENTVLRSAEVAVPDELTEHELAIADDVIKQMALEGLERAIHEHIAIQPEVAAYAGNRVVQREAVLAGSSAR